MDDAETRESPHGRVALAFAQALACGDFQKAHRMLSPILREDFPPSKLKHEYEQMFSYAGDTKATEVDVIGAMQSWPSKEDTDVGWAYASISGPDPIHGGFWNEAVAVIVEDNNGRLFIREIVWGRP